MFKTLNHTGANNMANPTYPDGRPVMFVCGDDAVAKELALELASNVVAGRGLDAGPLSSARALEGMTAVIVNLNRRYKGHAGVRIVGL